MSLPYEHVKLLYLVKSQASPNKIVEFVKDNVQIYDFMLPDSSPFTRSFYTIFIHGINNQRHVSGVLSEVKERRDELSILNHMQEYRGTFFMEQLILDGILEHPERDEILAVRL